MATIISHHTVVRGRIEGDEDLRVHGRVEGEVVLRKSMTIEPEGFVDGHVQVVDIHIHGALKGELVASGRVHLSSSARVEATLTCPVLVVEDGAQLKGDVIMDLDAPAVTSTRTASSAPTRAPVHSTTSSGGQAQVSSTQSTSPGSAAAASAATSAPATTVTVVEEAEDDAELEDVDELTVKELREMLREKDLPVSGTKQELIERLQESS